MHLNYFKDWTNETFMLFHVKPTLRRDNSYIKIHGLACFVLSKYSPWWSSTLVFIFGTCVVRKIIKWFDTCGEIWKLDWNICSLLPL